MLESFCMFYLGCIWLSTIQMHSCHHLKIIIIIITTTHAISIFLILATTQHKSWFISFCKHFNQKISIKNILTGPSLSFRICGRPKAFLWLHHIPGAPRNTLPPNFYRGPFPQENPPAAPPDSHTHHPKTPTLPPHLPNENCYKACGSIPALS